MDELPLESRKVAFYHGIVPTAALFAHAAYDVVAIECFAVVAAGILDGFIRSLQQRWS